MRLSPCTMLLGLFSVSIPLLISACGHDDTLEDQFQQSLTPIHTNLSYFKDTHGRYLFIHGVNVSGSAKFPASFDPATGAPSYVGKPFPLEEADRNFRILRELGFNTIRLVMTWEAIEHKGPGQYDEEYLDYIEQIVAKAREYGIYCLMDMHQDMFSRHLFKLFNDETNDGMTDTSLVEQRLIQRAETCCLEYDQASPPNCIRKPNNIVRGDGAPEWVVQLCLPEKDVGGYEQDQWGLPLNECAKYQKWTTDFYPFTLWGLNIFISLDVVRSFAVFFAGKDVYPHYTIEGDGRNVSDYLQDHFAEAWRQVARRVAKYPNVLGYDILNEPAGLYLVFSLHAMFWNAAIYEPDGTLTEQQANEVLESFLAGLLQQGATLEGVNKLRGVLLEYDVPLKSTSQLKSAGFYPESEDSPYRPDPEKGVGLSNSFNRNYLQPFHEKVGKVILEEDPDTIIFLELSLGANETGIGGMMASPMLRPEGIEQIAYGPHWYTDIYPEIGENMPPREFTVEEKMFRDYRPGIEMAIESSTFSLGNPPTVMGEFGTYYNFGGIEKSIEQDYVVSSVVLDRYFETYEEMLLHHIQWCYSPENTKENGEGWNKEDFSLLGPDHQPRSARAYSRPYPRYLSGKPVSMHFYSDFHYYDPDQSIPDPRREFEVTFKTRETDAPTEIFIPPVQYPDGFYVYLSDGHCYYDPNRFILYYYPHELEPYTMHNLRIRPPYPDYGDRDWDYFFHGNVVITNR